MCHFYFVDAYQRCIYNQRLIMRVVIQRVKEAQVKVAGLGVGQIAKGMLIFLGVARDDNQSCADYLVKKIT